MNPHPPTDEFPRTAEGWLARLLSSHCRERDHDAFEAWLAESPGNVTAYAQVENLHGLGAELAADPAVAEAARDARRSGAAAQARPPWQRPWPLAIAASVLLAVGAAAWLAPQPPQPAQHYATGIGELRNVTLDDGSTPALDAASQVAVTYARDERRIALQRGRLQVQVAHDAQRPLIVRAGPGHVRATGTVFQVDRSGKRVVVGLLEGGVVVSSGQGKAKLLPGQRIADTDDGALGTPEPLDADAARGWVNGELVFHDRRLRDLLDDFHRYSPTRFVLADPGLGDLRVSGVFRADDSQALLDTLRAGWSLQAARTGEDEITLSAGERH